MRVWCKPLRDRAQNSRKSVEETAIDFSACKRHWLLKGFMMSVNLKLCRLPLLAWLALIGLAPRAQDQTPPKSWIDPDTGHRVLRITDEPNSASLYFNDNAYTSDGKGMIYTTPDGISVVDLQTFKSKPVVHGRVRAIVAGAKTQNVYYLKASQNSDQGSASPGA